jgi:hypothetical protein
VHYLFDLLFIVLCVGHLHEIQQVQPRSWVRIEHALDYLFCLVSYWYRSRELDLCLPDFFAKLFVCFAPERQSTVDQCVKHDSDGPNVLRWRTGNWSFRKHLRRHVLQSTRLLHILLAFYTNSSYAEVNNFNLLLGLIFKKYVFKL